MSCFDKIKEQFKDIPDEVIRQIISEVEDIKGLSKVDSLKRLREKSPETLTWMKKRKVDQSIVNKRVRDRITQKLDKGEDPSKLFEELLVSSDTVGNSTKDSVSITRDTLFQRHRNVLETRLGKDIELLADPAVTKSVFKAIDSLNKGESVPTGVIRDLAVGVRDINKYVVSELNEAGIPVKDRADYIIRQTHDPGAINKVGFSQWKDFIYKELDLIQTFGDSTNLELHDEVLSQIYNDIISGGYSTQGAGSLGRARKLHFKNGEALANYHNKFGEGSVVDVLDRTLRAAAKAEATYRVLGPDGPTALDRFEVNVRKELEARGDKEGLKKFEDGARKRDNMRKQLFGYGDHPGHHWVGDALGYAQEWQAVTKLGFAATATLTDIAPATTNFMAKTGNNIFSGLHQTMGNYFRNLKGAERKKIGHLIGINQNFDTFRYVDEGSARGKFSKFTNFAMKFTLLDKVTQINRSTMATTFSSHIADNASKAFDDLDPRLKAELESYGLKGSDWDSIGKAVSKEIDGLDLIDPRLIENRDTQIKFQNFLWNNAKFGAIAPGDSTKAFARMGINPESVQGKALSTILQFKTFSLEASRAIREIVKSNPRADNSTFIRALRDIDNMKLLGHLSVLGFGSAAMGLWARDLTKGKTPRDFSGEFVVEALGRGVYPLWGQYMIDSMTGSYNNYGRSIIKDLAGPTASTVDDFAKLVSATATGSRPAGKAIRLIRRNTPLVNSPIIAPLLNKAFMNELMEWSSPGYTSRQFKRDLKRGQEDWLPL